MGIGVTCQLLGRVVMLPGEGLVNAIATHWKLDFGKIKVIFDWSLVAIAGGYHYIILALLKEYEKEHLFQLLLQVY